MVMTLAIAMPLRAAELCGTLAELGEFAEQIGTSQRLRESLGDGDGNGSEALGGWSARVKFAKHGGSELTCSTQPTSCWAVVVRSRHTNDGGAPELCIVADGQNTAAEVWSLRLIRILKPLGRHGCVAASEVW